MSCLREKKMNLISFVILMTRLRSLLFVSVNPENVSLLVHSFLVNSFRRCGVSAHRRGF